MRVLDEDADSPSGPADTLLDEGIAAAQSGFRQVARSFATNWVVELGVLAVLMVAYNVVRGSFGNAPAAAFAHARDIVASEGVVFDRLEVALNHWTVGVTAVAVVSCYFYVLMHYAATPLVLIMSRRRGGWFYWRGYWSLVLASAFALALYATYPVAPPRLVPDLRVVDVMRAFADFGWWGTSASAPTGIGDATNLYAAMPSMHCGWAVWCAIQLWGTGRRPLRVLAVAYPSTMTFVVLATGNHYVLDAVAGAACTLVAFAVVELVGRWLALHEVTGRVVRA